jgi:transposase-like protein
LDKQSAISNRKSKIENPACPFCKSRDTELIALFGQQMMTSQYFCNNCRTGFEAVKWNDNLSRSASEPLNL